MIFIVPKIIELQAYIALLTCADAAAKRCTQKNHTNGEGLGKITSSIVLYMVTWALFSSEPE